MSILIIVPVPLHLYMHIITEYYVLGYITLIKYIIKYYRPTHCNIYILFLSSILVHSGVVFAYTNWR